MAAKHAGLGRGLNALIKDSPSHSAAPAEENSPDEGNRDESDRGGVVTLPISRIHKSPWQPRRHFDPEALNELVSSIRERGVLQPLLVREVDNGYQLIAGERRFRAAQEAEIEDIPVIVMQVSDKDAVEITLIENLQREDLNPVEEAEGYHSLGQEFGMTQEQIAERVGKGRASVANSLRLLTLPDAVREMVADGRLSSGHAKVLLGVDIPEEQTLLAQRVLKEGLAVRSLERIVEQHRKPPRRGRVERSDIPGTHLQHLSDQLHQTLGTSVRLHSSKTLTNGKKVPGRVEIDFYSTDDLDRLLHLLGINEQL